MKDDTPLEQGSPPPRPEESLKGGEQVRRHVLLVGAVLALGLLALWLVVAHRSEPSRSPEVEPHAGAGRPNAFRLPLERGDVAAAHRALWDAVRVGELVAPPEPLPADYAHAFAHVFPPRVIEQSEDSVASGWSRTDPSLLVVLPNHGRGRVRLSFNMDRRRSFLDERREAAAASEGRWLVTAAYTSPLTWPAGAFVHEGEVRNAAAQPWEGVVVVGRDGTVRVLDAGRMPLLGEVVDLGAHPERWLDVLRAAEAEGATLFQQHLLVRSRQPAVAEDAPAPRAARRALVETAQGTVAVYDSGGEPLSLYELAVRLSEGYGAELAVNLDTGTYSVSELYADGGLVESRSTLGEGVVLTSLLEIDGLGVHSPSRLASAW